MFLVHSPSQNIHFLHCPTNLCQLLCRLGHFQNGTDLLQPKTKMEIENNFIFIPDSVVVIDYYSDMKEVKNFISCMALVTTIRK